ncbi:MAG: DUF2141 domain-containing protein [Flavobacteriales bacterium]|nr:DUF2141 domain-containing protein [Flavobacteriales bacterium]
MKLLIHSILVIIAYSISAFHINAQSVSLSITNLKSSKGNVVLGIYKDQATFDKETPFLNKTFPKGNNVTNGTLKVNLDLPPGVYGITMLDDENADGKMEYTWYGMPEEGFGFSDYYHTGFMKPKFKSFAVTVTEGKTTISTLKVRYL